MIAPNNKAVLLELPDPAICRARLVLKGVVDCLVQESFLCPYALSYGNNILCTHPLAEMVIANTPVKRVAAPPTRPDSVPQKPAKLSMAA
jgi:hypothetical protein